jgi:hypothetical protein
MNTYPITNVSKNNELQNIKTILHNKNYPSKIIQNKQKQNLNDNPPQKQKWATFTYFGK